MTSIYIIRHAEAEGNLYRIAQGQANSILTDRGWRQVAALARRFENVHIDAVYSSDLYRTCATASAIYRPKQLPLHRCPGLREICVGVWEQKTWGEIAREEPKQLEYFTHQLHLWHAEGAETPAQVRDRVLAAVKKIAAENDGRTVAVFSHGCAIRILLATLQGIPIEELGKTPHGDNTAVSLLRGDGEKLEVVYRDDNSHLLDPAYTHGEPISRHANALALRLRDGMTALGVPFPVPSPSNQQFPVLPNEVIAALEAKGYEFETDYPVDQTHTCVRFVTSWATPETAVEELLADLGQILGRHPA